MTIFYDLDDFGLVGACGCDDPPSFDSFLSCPEYTNVNPGWRRLVLCLVQRLLSGDQWLDALGHCVQPENMERLQCSERDSNRFSVFIQCVTRKVFAGSSVWGSIAECLGDLEPGQPDPDPDPMDETLARQSRVSIFSGSGRCTGSLLRDILPDGRRLVLTAAHCVRGAGGLSVSLGQSGQRVNGSVLARNERADLLLVACRLVGGSGVVFADVRDIVSGRQVFHKGFGVDVPGNREGGKVVRNNPGQMIQFEMSASPGDSGAGIFLAGTSLLVTAVCCVDRFPARFTYGGQLSDAVGMVDRVKSSGRSGLFSGGETEIEPLIYGDFFSSQR